MELTKAYYIYLKGYRKGGEFTLKEWLEAKEVVHANRDKVRKINGQIDTAERGV